MVDKAYRACPVTDLNGRYRRLPGENAVEPVGVVFPAFVKMNAVGRYFRSQYPRIARIECLVVLVLRNRVARSCRIVSYGYEYPYLAAHEFDPVGIVVAGMNLHAVGK